MENKTKTITAVFLAIAIVSLIVILNNNGPIINKDVKKFSSDKEIMDFLKTHESQNGYEMYGTTKSGTAPNVATTTAQDSASSESGSGKRTHSTTNIQVAGVDEPDIVKNDDQYIYTAFDGNITIVKAYPAENAQIQSIINIDGYIQNIFINGNKLVAFGQENYDYPMYAEKTVSSDSLYPRYYSPKSFVRVYDISDKEDPRLIKNLEFDGSYYDSRMIGDYVYVITNQPISYIDSGIVLPEIRYNDKAIPLNSQDISYFNIYDNSYQLTTIFTLNLASNSDPEKNTFMTGYAQNLFVSENNIYLVSQKQMPYYNYQNKITEEVILDLVDYTTRNQIRSILNSNLTAYEKQDKMADVLEAYYNGLSENEKEQFMKDREEKQIEAETKFQKEYQKTLVYKIGIDGNSVEYKAKGEVPGSVLNQFSMDEYKGNFRIATTTGNVWDQTSLNHIYVLNEDLNIIGKVEDLAHGETIYSARFLGNRAYMVTFKKIDPLFVIDLSNAHNPKILGELKIPGFSDYLHPYDENHIIGIGKEAEEVDGKNFAWYQGVKVALFDVSDVSNPKEISKFNIGDRGTSSDALYDHKAFLFDKEKGIIVMPIQLYGIDQTLNPEPEANTYGKMTFSGAYVLSINLNDGIDLKGRITHLNESQIEEMLNQSYYYNYDSDIKRSLYIDNVLYTISQGKIKANSLTSLQEIKEIKLPHEEQIIRPYMVA